MLVELSLVEQRSQAVPAVVQDGWKVSEVAEHWGCRARASMRGSLATRPGALPLSPSAPTGLSSYAA
jgi:hypothetical protein